MDASKRKALEAAGWKVGDAADFLDMNDSERQLLETRVQLAHAIRQQRQARKLSQKQLGLMLHTSQPRIAKIERAAADVSIDQLFRAFTAAGGTIVVKAVRQKSGTKSRKSAARNAGLVLELGSAD